MGRGIKEDLIGKRYGMLVIIDSEFRNNKSYCYCKCDCGNEKWIRKDSIKSGMQKSCGCLRVAIQIKSKDITGIKYSMLTPIKHLKGSGVNEVWLCRCDCGNEVKVLKKNIYSSSNNSCGCSAIKQKLEASKKAFKKNNEDDWIDGTSINKINREKPLKSNKSGVTGVSWDGTRCKWTAQIDFKGVHYNLGRYNNKEDAIKARKEAEKIFFKPLLEKLKKARD